MRKSKTILGYNLYLKESHIMKVTFQTALGLPYIPVTTSSPQPYNIPVLGGATPAYMLDVHRLSDGQITSLVSLLAHLFNVSPLHIARQLAAIGMPVVARDCAPPTPVYTSRAN